MTPGEVAARCVGRTLRAAGLLVPARLRSAVVAAIGCSLLPGVLAANVIPDASGGAGGPDFNPRVKAALAVLGRSEDAAIRRLHAAVVAAPATILVRPITDDPATWHHTGDRDRQYTLPADAGAKNTGRVTATGAIIYVTPDAVDPGSRRWKSGVLVHELVHAMDLAYGRYHRDDPVRERRAVFMQNIWRARLKVKLRTTYHGLFATLDYQDATRRGTVAELLRYVFTRSDFPPPPSAVHLGAGQERD